MYTSVSLVFNIFQYSNKMPVSLWITSLARCLSAACAVRKLAKKEKLELRRFMDGNNDESL